MKYYIIAGEASGDLHGSNLMRALIERDPLAEIRYWGGDRMASVSDTAVQVKHIRDLAIMGFVEVLMKAKTVLRNIDFCKKDILSFHPDVVVMVDYPGFNLKIARFAHAQGFKTVFYISPQIWAWKSGRIKSMRRDLDKLCYILPSERDYFAKVDFPAGVYVGHPLLDEVERYRQQEFNSTDGSDSRPVIALLPGSRKQEIKQVLPVMLSVARLHPEYQFIISGMSLVGSAVYDQYMKSNCDNVRIEFDATYGLLSKSYAALVCSGTATLETALFRVPQVVLYKGNWITMAIGAVFIKLINRLKYISLVNITADRKIVTELLQTEVNQTTIDKELCKITKNLEQRQLMLQGYEEMITKLGDKGASGRTADVIIKEANKK